MSLIQFLILYVGIAHSLFMRKNDTHQWELYANCKHKIKFPTYKPAQRVSIAEQIQKVFQVYVNRESKIQNYGSFVDPIPRIQSIVANASSMSDQDFHTQMASTFLNLRDFHTNYYLPKPYSCNSAIWPIEFGLIRSDDLSSNPIVAVKSFAKVNLAMRFAHQVRKFVEIGDILVSYNNKTFAQLFEEHHWLTGGANTFGGQRSLLSYLSFRSGRIFLMPEETEAVYVLKKPNGRQYTVTAPIVIRTNIECMSDPKKSLPIDDIEQQESSKGKQTQQSKSSKELQALKFEKMYGSVMAIHPYLDDFKASFEKNNDYSLFPTIDETLSWSIYNKGETKIGLIRLESFSPSTNDVDLVLKTFRDLLVNELKDTSALLIDVRNNGGGIITLSDSLPQFFVPDYNPPGARSLMSDVNSVIYKSPMFNSTPWGEGYFESSMNSTYSKIIQFTSLNQANAYGQAYFKPVGVLNNGNCYSACDLFSANMQDSGAAIVFGEDPQTGAGGANVVELEGFLAKVAPDLFRRMPNGQNVRVGWRQLVRNGKNQGKIVEDVGVYADVVIRPFPKDFHLNRTKFTQLDEISVNLKVAGRKDGRAFRTFETDQDFESDAPIGSPIEFTGIVSWIHSLQLLRNGTELVNNQKFRKSKEKTKFSLKDNKVATGYKNEKFTIIGKMDNQQIIKTHRLIRTIPSKSSYLSIKNNDEYVWNFEISDIFIGLYNQNTEPKYGWIKKDKSLVIGTEKGNYTALVTTSASLFITIPRNISIGVDIKALFDTEPDCDIFSLEAISHQLKLKETIFSQSGFNKSMDNMFSISKYAGYDLELAIKFKSDPLIEGKGVEIERFSILSGEKYNERMSKLDKVANSTAVVSI